MDSHQNCLPITLKGPNRVPMVRRELGSNGTKLSLLTNHFEVNVGNTDGYFIQYSVALFYEDGCPVEGKGSGRKILDRVQATYNSELNGKDLVYDGEKTLFTTGSLAQNKLEFTVDLEDVTSNRNNGNLSPKVSGSPNEADRKRVQKSFRYKKYKVEISLASKIPLQAIANALKGNETENNREAIRMLDIILRQHAAKQGCLLVRQNFFHNDANNFTDVGGGVLGARGLHSSFRTTQSGLSLNIDASTTMILRPGPVVDFLMANQNASDPLSVDWPKAKRTLKNLRVKTKPSNREYKITGLSDLSCKEQMFTLKKKRGDGEDDSEKISVYDYFVNRRNITLGYSADLPCINIGKPKRPTYVPIELCDLISLQRYTKSISPLQRSSLIEMSRQKPQERMRVLSDALKSSNYDSEPMLRNCGISITSGFTQVDGRVLEAPRLKFGNGEDFNPRNGKWNLNNKKFVEPVKIVKWAVVNFSTPCDVQGLVSDLIKCGRMKGIQVEHPFDVYEEQGQFRCSSPVLRVEKMFEHVLSKHADSPQFLLCLLPERKICELYGPWKKKSLVEFGIVTQCIVPSSSLNDQYLTNVLMKINAKLGGMNSLLGVEHSSSIPIVSKAPTLILGMIVSHGSHGHSDIPSIVAVVGSRQWPLISKYRACVRTQGSKVKMIDNLFKPVPGTKDDEGIIRELLNDFYTSSGGRKPENIIIFRDGVRESQFNQVLNIELGEIIKACEFLDETWNPKFTLIISQKTSYAKFFNPGSSDNVPAGTVVDNQICHPKNYDFYMCAHAGMIGTTSRPTHYHILLDEIGFSTNDLQDLVHSLSYVYQRSTTAISVVAPISYAHLAASQVGQFMKCDDRSETASIPGGINASPVPQLPKLKENVQDSMFFV
ncbi:protein argonaute 4-like [Vicia villosa]|uniref:protein argonaute 4-like n=1 Tax=Vicia villosa TaxID=3911 RepID=UPI00273AED76|nr:protein argonaute 4-like [Vicia villosa]